jgi:GINS complex subunit 3
VCDVGGCILPCITMNNYFDVNSILSEDTLIPTTLPCGMSDLGKVIDPSMSQLDLPPGAHVSLPFWVAKALLQHSMAEVEPPAVYGERYTDVTSLIHTRCLKQHIIRRYRRKMEAGAECVNLRIRAPFFYSVGLKYNELYACSPVGQSGGC